MPALRMTRVNKCIELLEQGRPVFVDHPTVPPTLDYDAGLAYADTWADMLILEFEHHPFDPLGLTNFMRGLRDGGPTASGHLTPSVVASLPHGGLSAAEVRANAWACRHALTTGIHGLILTHAREACAVECFVASCRYPFHAAGCDVLPEGTRGGGGEQPAAEHWGLTTAEYLQRAEPWPLAPQGELLLGLKIEDRQGLANADAIAAVSGVAFAEWGPLDMGMSFGYPDAIDPPYAPELEAALDTIRAALARNGVAFYSSWTDSALSTAQQLDHLVHRLGAKLIYANETMAALGRHGNPRSTDAAPQ